MINIKGAYRKDHPLHYEYGIYKAIKRRCYNKNCKDYIDYGAKKIVMSNSWKNSFFNFIHDMGKRPNKNYSIDRINNKKGYNKYNCRWADTYTQSANRRNVKQITFKNKSMHLNDWARFLNIKRSTLSMRIYIYKWPIEKALTTGVK